MASSKTVKRTSRSTTPIDWGSSLLAALDTNDRITRYLVEALDEDAWRGKGSDGKGRDIAAVVAHVHNVRLMWIKAVGVPTRPEQLDRAAVTRDEALKALGESHAALRNVVGDAIAKGGTVKGFKPDVVGFVGYHVAHEAHHRGQIAMLARQAGHAIPQKVMFGMWEWGSRGKEVME